MTHQAASTAAAAAAAGNVNDDVIVKIRTKSCNTLLYWSSIRNMSGSFRYIGNKGDAEEQEEFPS